jgi:hypothetical protein
MSPRAFNVEKARLTVSMDKPRWSAISRRHIGNDMKPRLDRRLA